MLHLENVLLRVGCSLVSFLCPSGLVRGKIVFVVEGHERPHPGNCYPEGNPPPKSIVFYHI